MSTEIISIAEAVNDKPTWSLKRDSGAGRAWQEGRAGVWTLFHDLADGRSTQSHGSSKVNGDGWNVRTDAGRHTHE